VLRAWAIFGATFGALQLVATSLSPGARDAITALLARATGALARLAGTPVEVTGSLLYADGYGLEVIWQCSGATPMAVFVAAVAAFPSSWRAKLVGWAIGLPLLVVANLARLLTLLWVGMHHPHAFDTMHLRVWQPLLILMTVVLWLAWVTRLVPRERTRAA
jgi:exosortase/archaeosortase family protein